MKYWLLQCNNGLKYNRIFFFPQWLPDNTIINNHNMQLNMCESAQTKEGGKTQGQVLND